MNNSQFCPKNKTKKIIKTLIENIELNKKNLLDLSMKTTGNSLDDTLEDYKYVINYLKNYIDEHYDPLAKKGLKPKGSVLLILSYNEPIIMNTIVVLNAIIARNKVFCKPSRRSESIFNKIWTEDNRMANLELELHKINANKFKIENIPSVDTIYFFGGKNNAKKIAKYCAGNLIEFQPEIETADIGIVTDTPSNKKGLNLLTKKIVSDSYTHHGQMCQRIQGVFVNQKDYTRFIKSIIDSYKSYNMVASSINCPIQYTNQIKLDISKSKPRNIFGDITKEYKPILIDSPSLSSDLIRKAYFYPILWVIKYKNTEDLIEHLNSREFFHGININGTDKNIISEIITKTRYSRITINSKHTEVKTKEGWGGVSPSGFGGNKDWLEKFSNQYTVLRK